MEKEYYGNAEMAGSVDKESIVFREMNKLEKAVKENGSLVMTLAEKLNSVLQPESPSKNAGIGVPTEPLPSLPASIREQAEKTFHSNSYLQDIIRRLSL